MRRVLLLASAALLAAVLPTHAQDALFSISVDGEHVAGTALPKPQPGAADIQVKYDGLGGKPILNVATANSRRSYATGERVPFLASSNYPAYIARREIRIYATGRHAPAEPVAIIEVGPDGKAEWPMPGPEKTAGLDDFAYVLRVYDGQGRFDETRPLTLARNSGLREPPDDPAPTAPGYSDDNTAFRNIPVSGGAITVAGQDVPKDARVFVMGEEAPVDADGRFVVQRILPIGDHDVDVALKGSNGDAVRFDRSINIPSSEWFYVGLADVTLGSRSGSSHIEEVKPGEYDGVYDKGRVSFYLKGKIKGSYLLTAAADTGDSALKDMLKGLDDKDPRSFLKRIDPQDYYPVYGDDSVAVEDAPTRGKFYVRLERGESHVMWGNFKTDIRGTEFLRNDRALYGADLVLKSDRMVPSGERAGELQAYAAQPGTLPQRDIFRGTGGSAYFLSHQDLTVGSETVSIETRNPVTGMVTSRRDLVYGRDYTIDYLQGVVLLTKPLASSAAPDTLVQDGGLGGDAQYLVAAYEFTPAAGDVNGYVYGGRAQQWLGDHVRLGATGALEKTGRADQKLAGADVQFYKSERTFLEGEVAVSEGPGFGFTESINGGITSVESGPIGRPGRQAQAYRVLGRADAADIVPGAKGDLQISYAYKQKGFATPGELVSADRHELGGKGDLALSERLSIDAYGDQLDTDGRVHQRRAGGGVTYRLTEDLSVSAGAQELLIDDPWENQDGERTDAAVKLTRRFGEQASAYVFGQGTLARSGHVDLNNRVGAGGTRALTDTLDAEGEISYGTSGIGARALLSYAPVAADRYYIGYALDPDSRIGEELISGDDGQDLGGIVAGVRHGFSERLSVYAEDKFDVFGTDPSLTQVYGVTYTPVPEWKLGGAVESGMIWGDTADLGYDDSKVRRTAFSATAAYSPDEKFTASLKGELRFDRESGAGDITSYYVAGRLSQALNPDWRFLASADVVLTDATESTRGGDYAEASLGYAYRPVGNDRFNALAKYVFLYDLPGTDQVSADGTHDGPSQLSHIFSVDADYDLTPMLSIGGKYGLRLGEWKPREGGHWESSAAQLGVLRADLHVVKNWDVLVEARCLWEGVSETANFGALAAIYRQLGDNFELGVGYNFGRFSDDLRDLTADDHGFFINAVGKL